MDLSITNLSVEALTVPARIDTLEPTGRAASRALITFVQGYIKMIPTNNGAIKLTARWRSGSA